MAMPHWVTIGADAVPRARHEGEIDVFELKKRVDAGEKPLVIDVREPHEHDIAEMPFTTNLPLSVFEQGWQTLLAGKENEEVILSCRSGGRSAQVQAFLKHHGFQKTRNLVGGILAWATAIDRTMQTY